MKIFAISDLHLSGAKPKPMDIFGKDWVGYEERVYQNWQSKVGKDDVVLVAGDISWAMAFDDAMVDLETIGGWNGKKVLLRGNHDYWWKSISNMRAVFPPSVNAVQNDCLRYGKFLICGTRGWTVPEPNMQQTAEDVKIFARETERLKLTLESMRRMRQEGDVVIAMMHFPPFNLRREPSAFTQLLSDYRVDAVVYGHLHGKSVRADRVWNIGEVPYYLTSLDLIGCDPVLIASSDE